MDRSYPTYIITQEPKQTPRKKGPFYSSEMVENFLREAYGLYPGIICIVITDPLDNGWYPEHGYEWLDINGDRRKRHPRKDQPSNPTPAALSSPPSEPAPQVVAMEGLQTALRDAFMTCVAGDGKPYIKLQFSTLDQAHFAHDMLLAALASQEGK